MERVKLDSETAFFFRFLYLNVGKTKVMMTEDQGEMVVDGKHIEVVSHFIFLGSLLTKYGERNTQKVSIEYICNRGTNGNLER